MLGTAVRKLVTLPIEVIGLVCDLLEKLTDPEWVAATKRFLRKEKEIWPEIKKVVSKLLTLVKEIEQPAIAPFSPSDNFKVTPRKDRKNAKVVIGYVDPDLVALFDSIGVEPARGAETVQTHRLDTSSKFVPILAELSDKAKTTLGRAFQMMEKQGHGEEGNLLVNGWGNFFFIEGTDWVFGCYWSSVSGGWLVSAFPVSFSNSWSAGSRFVSLADS